MSRTQKARDKLAFREMVEERGRQVNNEFLDQQGASKKANKARKSEITTMCNNPSCTNVGAGKALQTCGKVRDLLGKERPEELMVFSANPLVIAHGK